MNYELNETQNYKKNPKYTTPYSLFPIPYSFIHATCLSHFGLASSMAA